MMKRQPDGTWRNARSPVVVSPDLLRSRWVEAEVLRLKTMGLSFEEIAEQVTHVGRGKSPALVAIPPGVTFPDDYSITRQACHKSFRKALARQPALELEELRKLDNARSEEMFSTCSLASAREMFERSRLASRSSTTRRRSMVTPRLNDTN